MTGAHARLAPSSAARWMACPGSVLLEAGFPETEQNPAAAEGDAAHWAASELLTGAQVAVGQVTPNGAALTDEMIDAAELYADNVVSTVGAGRAHVEERVAIPWVGDDCSGTPDAWAMVQSPDGKRSTLYVWDFKFGHRHVAAFENPQIIAYVCGLLDSMGIDGDRDQLIAVVIRIVQPRNYHRDGPTREWSVNAAQLRGLFNLMAAAAEATRAPNPPCVVNPECRDCRGRHACEALAASTAWTLDAATSSLPLKLPPEAVGAELRRVDRALELLKARRTGLEQDAVHTIRAGGRVPFFKIEASAGRERWKSPAADVAAMGALMGLDLKKPLDVVTPAQARKKGMAADVVGAFAERPSGALTLVPDDGAETRQAFSNQP